MRHLHHQHPARLALALLAAGPLVLAAPFDAAAAPGLHCDSALKQDVARCPGVGLTPSQDPHLPPFGLNPATDESYTEPAAAVDNPGRVEAFALDDDGTVQWVRQTTANGTTWSDWAELGSPPGIPAMSGPAIARDPGGRSRSS